MQRLLHVCFVVTTVAKSNVLFLRLPLLITLEYEEPRPWDLSSTEFTLAKSSLSYSGSLCRWGSSVKVRRPHLDDRCIRPASPSCLKVTLAIRPLRTLPSVKFWDAVLFLRLTANWVLLGQGPLRGRHPPLTPTHRKPGRAKLALASLGQLLLDTGLARRFPHLGNHSPLLPSPPSAPCCLGACQGSLVAPAQALPGGLPPLLLDHQVNGKHKAGRLAALPPMAWPPSCVLWQLQIKQGIGTPKGCFSLCSIQGAAWSSRCIEVILESEGYLELLSYAQDMYISREEPASAECFILQKC